MPTSRRRTSPVFLIAAVVAVAAVAAEAGSERREPPRAEPTAAITADEFLTRAAFLASDDFVGRESGTEGGRMTEEYLAGEMKRMGLEPLGTDGSFFQDVPLPTRNPDPSASTLAIVGEDGAPDTIGEPRDVVPFAFSAAGSAEGQVVFAGFGLTDGENEYDDYVGLDVNGKVVLILRHAPSENDPESPWAMQGRRGARAARTLSFTAKAARAAEAGAAAVLLVNDYNHEEDALPVTVRGRTSKVPVLAVTRSVAERLFESSGTTLKELQAQIDADRKPRSRALDVQVAVHAAIEAQTARNVIAVRRGSDEALRRQAVVFGAHMDHVGMGWFGSPAGGGKIHNGADDNASGTAALLEAAEWLMTQPAPRRSVVVAFWCGEEKGLVGSRHYAGKPIWPLEDTIACVNMDMVGRYRDGEQDGGIFLGGAPTGSTFTELVERLADAAGAKLTHTWNAWEQSDHHAFYAQGVPALFFTTGLHPQYHRPEDDWWLLNSEGAALVTGVAARTVLALADAEATPEFKKKPPRPVMGVRLADDPDRTGALMGMVFPNMGAAQAGIQQGDLVVAWNGTEVRSATELGQMIGASKAGDTVTVTVVRGEERLDLEVTLSGR
jgi:hypothetical protein